MRPRPALIVGLVPVLSACVFALVVRAQAVASVASVATFIAASDCFVDSAQPNAAFDATGTLYVARAVDKSMRHTLLRFDLANLGQAHVVSATQHLHASQTMQGPGDRDLQLERIAAAWPEAQTTWNIRPSTDKPFLQCTVDSSPGWKAFEVTELVAAWLAPGAANHGLMYSVEVAVPPGYKVQDVQMTSRGGLLATEGLSLALNVPITDGGGVDTATY